MRTSDPGGSFGGASDDPDRGDPRRRVTLRDAPYRARSLGGRTQVVVNLADHAAQIASSSVGPRRRRRDRRSAARRERGAASDADAGPPPVRADRRSFSRKRNGEPLGSPFLSLNLLRAAVTTDVDGLFQLHPRRLLEYSPKDLHTKGWFPWPSSFHLSVTVFASPELHAQTLVLTAWTAAIHVTGLGVEDSKQSGFKAIFGTAYLGSLASMGVIIALVLGLFISLVVQRWWDVRSQYATFHHALLELAVAWSAADARLGTAESAVSASVARAGSAERREKSSESSESSEETTKRLRRDATRELFRLLNLAHVLFLSQAGEREHAVTGARRLRRAGHFFSTPSRFVSSRDARDARGGNDEGSSLDESVGDEATRRVSDPSDDSIGDSGAHRGVDVDAVAVAATAGTNAESLADVRTDSDLRTPRRERVRGASSPSPPSEGTNASRLTRFGTEPRDCPHRPSAAASVASTAVFADDANILAKHVTHLDRDDCVALGLVTAEEWEALRAARAAGLPRFSAVLCWAHALLETCAARRVCSSAAKRTAIAKLADARQAAGRVSTYLMSQLPYTYVNLVSLVVHVYLFVLATWFGFILHSGLNAVEMNVAAEAAGAEGFSRDGLPLEPGETNPNVFRVSERRVSMSSDVLTVAFCYAFLAFSNVLFQGLLHIHALLDNPFGHHPAKFPLRQFVAQLVGQTSALLAGAHEPPAASPSVTMFRRSESGGESEEEREDPRKRET